MLVYLRLCLHSPGGERSAAGVVITLRDGRGRTASCYLIQCTHNCLPGQPWARNESTRLVDGQGWGRSSEAFGGEAGLNSALTSDCGLALSSL